MNFEEVTKLLDTIIEKMPNLIRLSPEALRALLANRRVVIGPKVEDQLEWKPIEETLCGLRYEVDYTLEPGTWRME